MAIYIFTLSRSRRNDSIIFYGNSSNSNLHSSHLFLLCFSRGIREPFFKSSNNDIEDFRFLLSMGLIGDCSLTVWAFAETSGRRFCSCCRVRLWVFKKSKFWRESICCLLLVTFTLTQSTVHSSKLTSFVKSPLGKRLWSFPKDVPTIAAPGKFQSSITKNINFI